ncbi:MAG: helix-turn-helix domain-containing protein [Treponema sp.]|jgi:transcriptional regulator with XRE-family HTH domain|nr:helix-turn-helix domain-containing protein [Treponema sp.]
MNVKFIFGKNLKFYRKKKNFSQEELSEKVDISVKHLSSIERGLTFVSADLLEKLAASVEIPVFWFFMNEQEVFYTDTLVNTIDRVIEKNLIKAIEDIKSDIRQKNY